MIFLVAIINVGRGLSLRRSLWTICLKKPNQKQKNSNCSLLYQHWMFCGWVHPPQSFCINWFLYPLTSSFAPLIYCCSQGWVFLLKCCLWFIWHFISSGMVISTPTTHLVKLYKPSVQSPRPLLIKILYHITTSWLDS